MNFTIRKAKPKDSLFLFYLKNEEKSMLNSFNQNPIHLKDHNLWLKKIIKNKNKNLLIAEKNNEKIGMIRYDLEDIFTYVSINIEKKFRGLGYGAAILKKSENIFKKNAILIAKVKKINIKSINIFKKNGYQVANNKNPIILIKILEKKLS
jgi:UDP-2,4-diacetamido-2,4,6-trideoxy-beta-L-altropyranose hydrolase